MPARVHCSCLFVTFIGRFGLLVAITLAACSNAQPDAMPSPALLAKQRTSEIYATVCRPEWCYRRLGKVQYAEPLAPPWSDPGRIGAVEELKKLAIEKYDGEVDAVIGLRAVEDTTDGRMVVSGEAVGPEHSGAALSCLMQAVGSWIINLACDSQREGMIGDAEEYERLYNSLP